MEKENKEELYTITCNREQLKIISKAVETYSRRFSGQLELNHDDVLDTIIIDKMSNGTENFDKVMEEKKEIEYHLQCIKDILFPEFKRYPGASLGYNGNLNIGNSYQIYRMIEHVFALEQKEQAEKEGNHSYYSCYESYPLSSGNLGRIKVEKIKN